MATDVQGLVDLLLEKRGIKTREEREKFLNPDYELHTHDPFLLKGMEKTIERLYRAVKGGERIAIFSDYDADGIPGAVIAKDFLEKVGHKNFEIYIPHRHDEGFGLNEGAIDEIAERGAKVLLTIDCGIADAKEISYAKSKNIDVIITDHHETHGKLSGAFAVIDTKQDGCAYPEKNLCGSAIFFKVVQAFIKKHGEEFNVPVGWEKWLLDMVGIATLSDMVPLVGENRVFAHYGLVVMRKTQRPGLGALINVLRLEKKNLSEDDIGFSITPRINAASRMGTPLDAFNLLSAKEGDEIEKLAARLEHVNNERKGTVAALVKEIKKIVGERDATSRRIIVLGNPNWRPSLLGLAANTFAGEFSCPVFLWGRDGDNVIKGSARSGGGVNLIELMRAARPGVFMEFGGHAFSGGFSISNEAVFNLEKELEVALGNLPPVEKTSPADIYDAELSADDVSVSLYAALSKLSPYGMGNPKPAFLFRGVSISSAKTFGKEKNHFEVLFKKGPTAGEAGNGTVKAIQFFADEEIRKIKEGDKITFVGNLEKSTFGNRTELRVRILKLV